MNDPILPKLKSTVNYDDPMSIFFPSATPEIYSSCLLLIIVMFLNDSYLKMTGKSCMKYFYKNTQEWINLDIKLCVFLYDLSVGMERVVLMMAHLSYLWDT